MFLSVRHKSTDRLSLFALGIFEGKGNSTMADSKVAFVPGVVGPNLANGFPEVGEPLERFNYE